MTVPPDSKSKTMVDLIGAELLSANLDYETVEFWRLVTRWSRRWSSMSETTGTRQGPATEARI